MTDSPAEKPKPCHYEGVKFKPCHFLKLMMDDNPARLVGTFILNAKDHALRDLTPCYKFKNPNEQFKRDQKLLLNFCPSCGTEFTTIYNQMETDRKITIPTTDKI